MYLIQQITKYRFSVGGKRVINLIIPHFFNLHVPVHVYVHSM